MIRIGALVAVPALLVGGLLLPGPTGPAAAATGCVGTLDVAVGAPAADVAGASDAGEVTIVFESGSTSLGNPADRTVSETTLYQEMGSTRQAAAGDRFGASVAVSRSPQAPGCSVVAVGAPGADDGAGVVWVFTIDEYGFLPDSVRRISQSSSGIPGSSEAGDGFGSATYFGGGSTARWLAVGSPHEDVGKATDAGSVLVLPYPGLGVGTRLYRQGAGGIPGVAEKGDHFGAALGPGRDVWSLWVGAPEENLGSLVDAGALVSLPGSISTGGTVRLPGTIGRIKTVTQDSPRVPGVAERGDHFAATLSGLVGPGASDREPVVGVPGEDIGTAVDAGAIVVTYSDVTWASFQRGGAGVSGGPSSGDRFGAALSAWEQALLVGAPGVDVGAAAGAGVVQLMWAAGDVPKLAGSREQMVSLDSADVAGTPAAGDGFGSAVAFGVRGAVVGVPGHDVATLPHAGAVAFLPYLDGAPERGLTGLGSALLGAADLSAEGTAQSDARFGATAASLVS